MRQPSNAHLQGFVYPRNAIAIIEEHEHVILLSDSSKQQNQQSYLI